MKWIKCTDKMPECRQEVIFTDGKEICQGEVRDGIGYAAWFNCNNDDCTWIDDSCICGYKISITHWMLLPENPKDE